MRPFTIKSASANFSFADDRPQLQADAAEADNTMKTEAATKAAARYDLIESPTRAAQILARVGPQHDGRFVRIEAI
ncbi:MULTISPECIES: hypothetical protein [Rhizobium]|uniref:hypothetical protein n=1 Tax=Rhizobium TaxID=379 RepID=UPI000AB7D12E|nr:MULTISPECIES: hypothetical protein [Rhizobium]RVU08252.1 hypothetical protein EOS93_24640 [Rhizobium sp. RMa-01]